MEKHRGCGPQALGLSSAQKLTLMFGSQASGPKRERVAEAQGCPQ